MKKHSVLICGHATSISLEEPFWVILKQMAKEKECSLACLITETDNKRTTNLSSALRIEVIKYLQSKIA
ncbi:MAG: ribbon-helix-helix domain-containing protein [Alphaproteobacteria bacterium]|nr:ribbon-helix-helix domain-containing protein [Alphaproteobacteria bacterium]